MGTVPEAIHEAFDGLGEALSIFLFQLVCTGLGMLCILLAPYQFQLLDKPFLFPGRNRGQDVAHEVYLAPFPYRSDKAFLDCCKQTLVGIGNHQPDLPSHVP